MCPEMSNDTAEIALYKFNQKEKKNSLFGISLAASNIIKRRIGSNNDFGKR